MRRCSTICARMREGVLRACGDASAGVRTYSCVVRCGVHVPHDIRWHLHLTLLRRVGRLEGIYRYVAWAVHVFEFAGVRGNDELIAIGVLARYATLLVGLPFRIVGGRLVAGGDGVVNRLFELHGHRRGIGLQILTIRVVCRAVAVRVRHA